MVDKITVRCDWWSCGKSFRRSINKWDGPQPCPKCKKGTLDQSAGSMFHTSHFKDMNDANKGEWGLKK